MRNHHDVGIAIVVRAHTATIRPARLQTLTRLAPRRPSAGRRELGAGWALQWQEVDAWPLLVEDVEPAGANDPVTTPVRPRRERGDQFVR